MTAALVVRTSTERAMTDDTTTTTVPAGDDAVGAPGVMPPRWHRWWAIPLAVLSVAVVVLVAVAAVAPASLVARELNERIDVMQPAPYARVPAGASPITDRISISSSDQPVPELYPPAADLMLVTITEPRQSVLSWWVGRGEPAVVPLTREDKFGIRTPDQQRVFSLEMMRTSEEVAQYVAFSLLGYDAEILPGDVLIAEMACMVFNEAGTACEEYAPSDEVLDPGDRLIEADGVTLNSVDDLTAVLGDRSPGDDIDVLVERRGTGEFRVLVELTSAPGEDRTIVGFVPFDTRRISLPFDVDINTGSIGGPSAGLAFTLSLIDRLTAGELTGGSDVAVTGTIGLDGSVGPIGGLPQKASAVAQRGIGLFLIPAAQSAADVEAARAAAPGLQIVPVADVFDALDALVAAGGDPVDIRVRSIGS